MKRYITLIATMALTVIAMIAQDTYYYSNGGKIPLIKDSSRIAVVIPSDEPAASSPINAIKPAMQIDGNGYVIAIYNVTDYETLRRRSSKVHTDNTLPCYVDANGTEITATRLIYVKLKSASDIHKLQSTASAYDCTIIEQNSFMPLWFTLELAATSNRNPVDVANKIYESGEFASSSPDLYVDPLEYSYDPELKTQWGLFNSTNESIDISASDAWNYATGRGIKIAIVDECIESTHDDLVENLFYKSYDAYSKASPSKFYSRTGHGTHCAGIAAAVRNNGKCGAGVAPDATLISISLNYNVKQDFYKQAANGINRAWQNGADIISCSWKCGDNELVREAIQNVLKYGRNGRGCVIVKSAGNDYSSISFPGTCEGVITVGAISRDGEICPWSNHGDNLLVCAPGDEILSTMINNSMGTSYGTSMACPHVSGVAALILEINKNLTYTKVREIIAKSAKKISTMGACTLNTYGSWNEHYGYGLLDAHKAVRITPRE